METLDQEGECSRKKPLALRRGPECTRRDWHRESRISTRGPGPWLRDLAVLPHQGREAVVAWERGAVVSENSAQPRASTIRSADDFRSLAIVTAARGVADGSPLATRVTLSGGREPGSTGAAGCRRVRLTDNQRAASRRRSGVGLNQTRHSSHRGAARDGQAASWFRRRRAPATSVPRLPLSSSRPLHESRQEVADRAT